MPNLPDFPFDFEIWSISRVKNDKFENVNQFVSLGICPGMLSRPSGGSQGLEVTGSRAGNNDTGQVVTEYQNIRLDPVALGTFQIKEGDYLVLQDPNKSTYQIKGIYRAYMPPDFDTIAHIRCSVVRVNTPLFPRKTNYNQP